LYNVADSDSRRAFFVRLNAWDRTSERRRTSMESGRYLCDGADDVVAILTPGMHKEDGEGKGRRDEEEEEEVEERGRRTQHFSARRWRGEAGVGFEERKERRKLPTISLPWTI
jgi:hypothetical protein